MKRPQDISTAILGFTNDYYTLWSYYEAWLPMVNDDGKVTHYFPKASCTYKQNVAMDYDQAVEYMNKNFPNGWDEDLNLRGEWFSRRDGDLFAQACPSDMYKFGKYRGEKLEDINDVSYLMWYRKSVQNQYPEAYEATTKVLIDMGELIEYKGEVLTHKQYEWKKADEALNVLESGLHFNDGERIELQVKEVSSFSFEGNYGTTYVVTYATTDGKLLKYMGGSPADVSTDEFVAVKATVAHSQYKGTDETKLKRIKVQPKKNTLKAGRPLHQQLNGWDGHSKKGEAIYDAIFEQEKEVARKQDCIDGICSCCEGSSYYGI